MDNQRPKPFDPVKAAQERARENDQALKDAYAAGWNARGEADAKAVDERLALLAGWVTSEPYRQHMREAIKALDHKHDAPTVGVLVSCGACGTPKAIDGKCLSCSSIKR